MDDIQAQNSALKSELAILKSTKMPKSEALTIMEEKNESLLSDFEIYRSRQDELNEMLEEENQALREQIDSLQTTAEEAEVLKKETSFYQHELQDIKSKKGAKSDTPPPQRSVSDGIQVSAPNPNRAAVPAIAPWKPAISVSKKLQTLATVMHVTANSTPMVQDPVDLKQEFRKLSSVRKPSLRLRQGTTPSRRSSGQCQVKEYGFKHEGPVSELGQVEGPVEVKVGA